MLGVEDVVVVQQRRVLRVLDGVADVYKRQIYRLLPYLNKDLIEAGCDEAGRGCLAGAVYAAAVILPRCV